MSNLIIRKAREEDVPSLALLARVTFREAFGHLFKDNQNLIDYFAITFSIESLTEKLRDENNVFWLALVDNLPVGYAKLLKHSPSKFIKDSGISELQRIYILNDFLNQNIGHQLQEALFNEVKQVGSKHLWLSVYVDNRKAIRFYKRYDFQHIGFHTFSILRESLKFSVMKKTF